MFKKPLSNLKTSAPLRSSDRRKLKQRIVESYSLSPTDGDLLVPDGLLSVKFITHLDEPGTAYLAPDGDPLWFTIGKGSDDLIPTVYTLWKKSNLLPLLSTPSAVIPVLVGGADLMIPGVVHYSPSLQTGQLVSITQYERDSNKRGPPLAVGHMAVDGNVLSQSREGEGMKGKAVYVLHTWKDFLWEMGSGGEVPAPETVDAEAGARVEGGGEQGDGDEATPPPPSESPSASAGSPPPEAPREELQIQAGPTYTPQEVTSILRSSLIQAINTSLSRLPPSAFPIPATTFYTSHILPSRPAFPPSSQPQPQSTSSSTPSPTPTQIDIKHSTHKSLTTFLKAAEKEGLLNLKSLSSKSKTNDGLVITAVHLKHNDVLAHRVYATVGDVEAKREKKEEREEAERRRVKEMGVVEMWKPFGAGGIAFFEGCGKSSTTLYTLTEIKSIIIDYVTEKDLVNPRERQYINVDPALLGAMTKSGSGGAEAMEFLKRDEVVKKVVERMQGWYEVSVEGRDPVLKKGTLKPISIVAKIRQGRKASTLITGFEPFLLVAEELAEELRKVCASATSVSPIPGKTAGLEVLVQGKQIKAVTDLLVGKGVPKKWIESVDLGDKKK